MSELVEQLDQPEAGSRKPSLELAELLHAITELKVSLGSVNELRLNDRQLFQDLHERTSRRLHDLQSSLPTKGDLSSQVAELRQRAIDMQALETSLREQSTQTIRSSLQTEASLLEQKLNVASQQRYSSLEGQIERSEILFKSEISQMKTSFEAQAKGTEAALAAQIDRVDASLEAKIRGQVMQGIMWGMGIVGSIIAIAAAVIKHGAS